MNFIVFDLEATCWRGRPPGDANEVIEIGAYKISALGQVVSIFNKFIKPTVNPKLSKFCKELTNIKQVDVDRSNKFPVVLEQFQDWINIYDEDYLLCSWGDADIRLLRNDCILHDLEHDWLVKNIDVKNQYHEIKGKVKYGGLKKTVEKEGFEFTGLQHRAIADAENLAKVFMRYIDEWMF